MHGFCVRCLAPRLPCIASIVGQSANEELARLCSHKEAIEREIATIDLKVNTRVERVQAEFNDRLNVHQRALEDIQAQRNHAVKRSTTLAKDLEARMREARENHIAEREATKTQLDSLQEELARKNRSLRAAMEAMSAMESDSQAPIVDSKTQLLLQDLQDTCASLKQVNEKLRQEKLLVTTELAEIKVTGRVRHTTNNVLDSV